MNDVPEVLFVCVHNAGRSQMAAALLDHHPNGKVVVRSVGSDPADALNPGRGHGRARHRPVPGVPQAAHRRISQGCRCGHHMGCGDACPIYPGKRYEDWQLQDPAGQPAGQPIEQVRRIRDQIDGRVQQLLAELIPASSSVSWDLTGRTVGRHVL